MPQRETSDNSVKVFSLNQTSQQKQQPSNKMSSSQTPQQKIQLPDEELDWIQMRIESGPVFPETTKEKMMRKIKSNPLVPIGCIATACALGYGLYNFRTGNRKMSQMMMRARIAAQGFTVVALIAGVVTTYGKTNN